MTARANNLAELRTIRFIAGIGLGGIMPNAVALVGEYTPRRLRVLMMLVVSNGFNVGAVIGGLVSAWMVQDFGWRSVFYVGGAIPVVIGLLMVFWIPESLQFLMLRGAERPRIAACIKRIDKTIRIDESTRFAVREETTAGVPVLR